MKQTPGKRYSAEEKARILEHYSESGLSLTAYCRQSGLCYATLRNWRERRGRADGVPRLVELRVADFAGAAQRIRLVLGNGVEGETRKGSVHTF